MSARLFSTVAGIIAIGTGLYLANLSAADANSIIQSIANGIGWYFVARGIYMIASASQIHSLFGNQETRATKQCTACMSHVDRLASKCKHCGSELSQAPAFKQIKIDIEGAPGGASRALHKSVTSEKLEGVTQEDWKRVGLILGLLAFGVVCLVFFFARP